MWPVAIVRCPGEAFRLQFLMPACCFALFGWRLWEFHSVLGIGPILKDRLIAICKESSQDHLLHRCLVFGTRVVFSLLLCPNVQWGSAAFGHLHCRENRAGSGGGSASSLHRPGHSLKIQFHKVVRGRPSEAAIRSPCQIAAHSNATWKLELGLVLIMQKAPSPLIRMI